VALDHLFGGCKTPGKGYLLGVLTIRVLGGPNLLWRTLPVSGELIRCQSDHEDYACSHGGVAMSSGNGTDTST
jgi:hypothetical protein